MSGIKHFTYLVILPKELDVEGGGGGGEGGGGGTKNKN